jgi:Protein of unknown function (DUF559)
VVVSPESAWRGPRGIRVHRTDVRPEDVITIDNAHEHVRLTSPLRTAWEIATQESIPTAVALLDAMTHAGHLDVGALHRLAQDRRGAWGARRFAKVAPLVDGRSQSRPESLVRVACLRAGLPAAVPQHVVMAGDVFLGQVDLAWPEARLIVEYEGAHHFDDVQIRKDDRRYARLVAAGWRVIRLSSADLRDLDAVVARIRALLGVPLVAG